MRIIDSKIDFYDHLQHAYKDDSIVFDRRGSFVYKKKDMIESIRYASNIALHDSKFSIIMPCMLMQICNKFWLFYIDTKISPSGGYYDRITDYSLELLDVWDDYTVKRKLIHISVFDAHLHLMRGQNPQDANLDKFKKSVISSTKFGVHTNQLRSRDITRRTFHRDIDANAVPILKDTGITKCVLPLDVYLAFEEYWYTERASNEKRESVGLTDIEKAENHGFDKKTSFRGKYK